MSNPHSCRLTARDFNILETLLERGMDHDPAFLRLLRHKLSTAQVTGGGEADPQVATVNSRVDFTIDGRRDRERVLVHGDEDTSSGTALPITTLRGLALLGLRESQTIIVEGPDGHREEIRLDRIRQAEAAGAAGWPRLVPQPQSRPPETSSVVSFVPRPRPAPLSQPSMSFDPDDDDPGPSAA